MTLFNDPFDHNSNEPFWKNGLSSAWGDPNYVTENTLLTYRWPSILQGWERGLVSFSKAQVQYFKSFGAKHQSKVGQDSNIYNKKPMDLLRDVLNLPHTRVLILHGSMDKVVPLKNSQLLEESFGNLRLVVLDGQGHDPFEEKVDEFIEAAVQFFNEGTLDAS